MFNWITNYFKKKKAAKYSIPFFIKEYWPYYQRVSGYPSLEGFNVHTLLAPEGGSESVGFNYIPEFARTLEQGDITPFLHKTGTKEVHFYRILKKVRSPGSDHIACPMQFDIQYERTETWPEVNESGKGLGNKGQG